MDGRPPLPNDPRLNPPLPSSEPLSQSRSLKRLGSGEADGVNANEPPGKKTRREEQLSPGVKGRKVLKVPLPNKPLEVADVLGSIGFEDGEVQDSDGGPVVKDTYMVIDKKAHQIPRTGVPAMKSLPKDYILPEDLFVKKNVSGVAAADRRSSSDSTAAKGRDHALKSQHGITKSHHSSSKKQPPPQNRKQPTTPAKTVVKPTVAKLPTPVKTPPVAKTTSPAAAPPLPLLVQPAAPPLPTTPTPVNVGGPVVPGKEAADPIDPYAREGDDAKIVQAFHNEDGEVHDIDEFFDAAIASYPQQFSVIDDIDDEDSDEEGMYKEEYGDDDQQNAGVGQDEEYDSELDEEEIEALLEQDFAKKKDDTEEKDFYIREKEVLIERSDDPFDILPEFWIKANHNCGMPVYLHSKSRVCTMSRPYFLGTGSIRKHDVPMSALPCYNYEMIIQKDGAGMKGIRDEDIPDKRICDVRNRLLKKFGELPPEEDEEDGEEKHVIAQPKDVITETNKQAVCPVKSLNKSDRSDNKGIIELLKLGLDQLAKSPEEAIKESVECSVIVQKIQADLRKLASLSEEITASKSPVKGDLNKSPAKEPNKSNDQTSQDVSEMDTSSVSTSENKEVTEDTEPIKQHTQGNEDKAETGDTDKEKSTEVEGAEIKENGDSQEMCASPEGEAGKGGEEKTENASHEGLDVQIKTIEEHKREKFLTAEQMREYCDKLFKFKKVYVKRFRSWKTRRAYHKARNNPHKPNLPGSTKLIMCPMGTNPNGKPGDDRLKKREFMLNPKGKSDICILHEYAQHSLRVQPKYIFEETANAMRPYSATILIHNIKYGKGTAASKKAAKQAAAKETLRVLLPGVFKLRDPDFRDIEEEEMTFFNDVKIEDPRVVELSSKAGEPMPYEILQECLRRNFGLGDTKVNMSMEMVKPQKSEFTMSVAQYEAKIICKSKREGKQRAAQNILQQMHKHITSWGSLLRLYARDTSGQAEMKAQKDSITSLQCKVTSEPNHAILAKLKEEMNKLKNRRLAVEAKVKGRIEMPGIELKNQSATMGQVELDPEMLVVKESKSP